MVGPTFEAEARDAVGSAIRSVCPWLTDHGAILSRTLDRRNNSREGDIMCYGRGDTLGACVASADLGVSIVGVAGGTEADDGLQAIPALPAVELPVGIQFSPTDASRIGPDPYKYIILETYSGTNVNKIKAKTQQLNSLLGHMMSRWGEQHGHAPLGDDKDITSIVGAAGLVLCALDEDRGEVLKREVARVHRRIWSDTTLVHLRRLARSGRLLVMVLCDKQCPATYNQRAVAVRLEALATVPEVVHELTGAFARLQASLDAVFEKSTAK